MKAYKKKKTRRDSKKHSNSPSHASSSRLSDRPNNHHHSMPLEGGEEEKRDYTELTIDKDTKALLARPLPKRPDYDCLQYLVRVEPTATPQVYQITLQQQQSSSTTNSSPAPITTWRSQAELIWLHEQLTYEYQGSLLVPTISSVLASTPAHEPRMIHVDDETDAHNNHEVSSQCLVLEEWLINVCNGIRGKGEWTLPLVRNSLSLMESSVALEAFWYRSGPLVAESHQHDPLRMIAEEESTKGTSACGHEDSNLASLWPWDFLPFAELCVGPPATDANPDISAPETTTTTSGNNNTNNNTTTLDKQTPLTSALMRQRKKKLPYTSRALGSANSLEILDSFAENEWNRNLENPVSNGLAIHSEFLEAAADLLLNYMQTAERCQHITHALMESEEDIGTAWKQLAACLSELFAYEKDTAENAKVGTELKVKKELLLHRKLEKSTVDLGARALAQQKTLRASTSYQKYLDFLRPYLVDLSAVEPSMMAYQAAMHQLEYDHSANTNAQKDSISASPLRRDTTVLANKNKTQVLSLEKAFCQAMTALCQATPTRSARMAWWYLKTEATQCAALHSSAASFRAKLASSNSSSSATQKQARRHAEADEADAKIEMDIVERILELRKQRKNIAALDILDKKRQKRRRQKEMPPEEQDAEESDDDELEATLGKMEEPGEEERETELCAKARLAVQQRMGRWNAATGQSIIAALDIHEDLDKMQDATKDQKSIHKYSQGLQDCLIRTNQAIEHIRTVMATTSEAHGHIRKARQAFGVETAKLWSGKFILSEGMPKRSSMPSMGVLARGGVDVSDPYGWSTSFAKESALAEQAAAAALGNLLDLYLESKEARSEEFLAALSDVLQEYTTRVEIVEGFLWMESVGNKLERFFNEKRTQALSAFERKTDLTSALNVATRKRMTQLVSELQTKLDVLDLISHTVVKDTKELHLAAKALKQELHDVAVRRLVRARELSTDKAIALLSLWTKEEEAASAKELQALGEAMSTLEKQFELQRRKSRSGSPTNSAAVVMTPPRHSGHV